MLKSKNYCIYFGKKIRIFFWDLVAFKSCKLPELLSIHCGNFLSHFPNNASAFFYFYQNPALFLVKFSRQKNLKLHTMQIFNKKNIRKAFSRSRTKIKQIYLSFSNMTRLKRLLVLSALKFPWVIVATTILFWSWNM